MYSHYKPLRNFLTKQDAMPGLLSVWKHGKAFEAAVRRHGRNKVFGESEFTQLYELEIIAREIVLNARIDPPLTYGALPSWDAEIRKVTDHVRKITSGISSENIREADDALRAILPLLHQQVPWQEDTFARLTRYIAIMRHRPLTALAEASLGISLSDLIKIAMAIAGSLNDRPKILMADYWKTPGISIDAAKRFFELTSCSLKSLRGEIRRSQVYDKTWAYTFNPMRRFPLIVDPVDSRLACGPIPQFLLWRVTDGLYYDLFDVAGFGNAFGDAIEAYVGEAINISLPKGLFDVQSERNYHVGKDLKLGADWCISDTSGSVFIECKAKRLRLNAKATGDVSDLINDFKALAKAIVQNYKNIEDARAGYVEGFTNSGLPIFNVVVTLEDWRLALPHLQQLLHEQVLRGLETEGLAQSLTKEVPYTLLSMLEFERRIQDTARGTVARSFERGAPPHGSYQPLFGSQFAELMPDIAIAAGLDRFGRQTVAA